MDEAKVIQLYLKYSKEFDDQAELMRGASGCYWEKMSLEQFTYYQSWQYKLKQWFKNLWIIKRFNRFIYRLKCIWWAITDLDRLDNY